jgi:hypothetical protein
MATRGWGDPTGGAKPITQRRYRLPRETGGIWEGLEMSEGSILPMKPGKPPQATRWREGSPGTLDALEGKMAGTPSPTTVSTKLQRIATLASEDPERVLTTLAHHIDVMSQD